MNLPRVISRNTINLQNAYDKERAAIVKLKDAKAGRPGSSEYSYQATQIEIIRQDLKYATVKALHNSKRKFR
jgi:hypothetical protein